MRWFNITWLKYIFKKPCSLRKIICRSKGHSDGVAWYHAAALEPDMHCKNCGDNLG